MRGSPPVQLALLLLGFLALAVPLFQLTAARSEPAVPATASATNTATPNRVPTTLRVRYAHQPATLSLKLGGRELLPQPDLSASPVEATVDLEIPAEGLELQVQTTWPAGTPETAVTVELEPDGIDAQSQTRWSSGSRLEEVLLFHWKP